MLCFVFWYVFLRIMRPPRSTRTDTLFPYTTLFRSKRGEPELLGVDNRLGLPVGRPIQILLTGADVIHSFSIRAFWLKEDAVPGRINERRSEEHTSELPSLMRLSYAVLCLKKKTQHTTNTTHPSHLTQTLYTK